LDLRLIQITATSKLTNTLRKLHATTIKDTIDKIIGLGGTIRQDLESDLLVINEELRASVVICRCHKIKSGSYRWKMHFDTGLLPDITIAIRMDVNNERPLDYYILPSLDIEDPKIRFKENNEFTLDTYRFDNLDMFFMLTERTPISEAA
jgi:hypothetical protein